MSIVRETKSNIEFVGKGWVNTINKPGSKYHGERFLNITLDSDVKEITVKKGQRLQLWHNKKREGKNDADYRLSIVTQ